MKCPGQTGPCPTVALATLALASSVGCGSCQTQPGTELRVEGPHPYARCAEVEAPEGTGSAGGVSWELDDRTIAIEGAGDPVTIAALRGPAPSTAPLAPALAGLAETEATFVLVVGGIGDDVATASSTLDALGALDRLVLVLAGGRDDVGVWHEAFDELDAAVAQRVLDARGLRRVAIGERDLLLLSGAAAGRYARTETSCGFGDADLDALRDVADADRATFVAAWAAPAGAFVGLEGGDPGDSAFGAWIDELAPRGGLYATPAGSVVRGEGAVGVGPSVGAWAEGPDGVRRPPGVVQLRLGEQLVAAD